MTHLLITILLTAAGGPRPERSWNWRRGLLGDDYTLDVATFTSDNCTGATQTFSGGTTLTFTRATAATCTANDGTTVQVSSGQPRCNSSGCLLETTQTNLVLSNRDMSNAAWTKNNVTCTATATGTDGVSNSASTCTASAGNGTILQDLTVASSARSTSLYIKRRTGSGTINATRDNGTTWIDISSSVTGSWTRVTQATFSGLSTTSANPTVGIRIVTNGDAVDIDMFQDEDSTFATSPIITAGTSVTRNFDKFTVTIPSWLTNTQGCIGYTSNLLVGTAFVNKHTFDPSNGNGYGLFPSSSANVAMYDSTNTVGQATSDMRGRSAVVWGSWAGSTLTVSVDGTTHAGTYDGALLAATGNIGSSGTSGTTAAGTYSNIKIGSTAAACQ